MRTKRNSRAGVGLALSMVLALGACASSGTSGGGGNPDLLTREQLIESRQPNLYQAVQSLRPRWLRSRGTASLTSSTEVVVFVNEAPYGNASNLSSIPIDAVLEIRYMSAGEAGARYGTAAGNGGLILVRTAS